MKRLVAVLAMVSMPAMADIEVSNEKYHPDENGLSGIFSYDVTNNYDVAVSALDLRVVASTPGREVPWADNRGSIDIPGGVEPGETRTLKNRAPREADRAVSEGFDVVFDVEPMAAYDASGSAIE
ncbi:hypothetical protein NPJ88_000545 [Halomonas elongata]|uniref:hypothetical protein n=1 Tax=Halomonas elongata TaxID=2746 RepID=UPI00255AB983|nr:hypothetical protein [Halomonas elongata]MDL4860812.1 hypothetical protein [Halomonas elongata]